ncbi:MULTISPECIES: TetR/AcrR family transcriptional regulator [Mycolicibacterium]|uniref:TetR/AcrR family transcriptional regulator n=1 Tax=Mycolicibacterium TaxID=1866885 RepID=UPI001F45B31C|nr:helix-turn-helix domain-containing protein [Mycolicibacterium chitae]
MSRPVEGTRQRLLTAAVESFHRHSVAGTSLQMISDDLGLTKSAIYHHFRTRDELLEAILEPVMADLARLVAAAESVRGARARADAMLTGFAALAVTRRTLIPVLTGDPGVADFLRGRPDWSALVQRQLALLADVEPGLGGQVKAAVVMAGISAAVGVDYPEAGDDLARVQDELVTAGRRTLGLRAPRET